MIPQTLYNLNLFIDGVNFAGIATQVTPPKLKIKAEDYRGGGMDAPIKMDLGLEALEANFSLSGMSVEALRFFGLADQFVVQKYAELGNVTAGRRVGRDHFQQATRRQIANVLVQHHHRLGTVEPAGVENGVGLLGHGLLQKRATVEGCGPDARP